MRARLALAAGFLLALALAQACSEDEPTPWLGQDVLWLTDPSQEVALEPAATVDAAGRVWVTWISWTNPQSEPELVLGVLQGGELAARRVLGPELRGVAAPTLASDGEGVYCAWEASGVVWGARAALDGDALTLSASERLSAPERGARLPHLAGEAGRLACVWQSNAPGGSFEVVLRTAKDGAWSARRTISDETVDADCWRPRAAWSPTGPLHLVWDESAATLMHARLDTPQAQAQLSVLDSAGYVGFPSLAVDATGDAWIAWERAGDLGQVGGLRAWREVALARLGPQGLRWAELAPAPERGRVELPELALVDGLPTLAHRVQGDPYFPRNPRRAPAYTTYLAAIESFSAPRTSTRAPLPASEGQNDADQTLLRLADGELALLFASDARTRVYTEVNSFDGPIEGRWRLGLLRVPRSSAAPELSKAMPPSLHVSSALPTPGPASSPGVLWGDLHRHTSRSRCAGDQDGLFLDALRWARRERVDFFAITDHFQHLQPWSWWQNARDVERWNDPPRTLVLHGLERALEGEGHQNLIFRSAASAQLDAPAGVAPGEMVAIPHMIYLGDNPFPPARWDGELQRLLEVYQANRGSYEGVGLPLEANGVRAPDSDLRTAHALGQTPGLIAASDHSQTGDGWAGVLVAERTRAALFDALRARHTLASTSRREVHLSLGELAMGDAGAVDPSAELVLQIPASEAPLAAIDILKNGAPWQRVQGQGEVELYALTTRYRQTPEDSPLVLSAPSGVLSSPRMRRAEKEGGRFEARGDVLALWRSGTSASLLFEISGADALEVAFGRSRQLVQLSELAPGASMRLMDIQGRLDHLWRLGPPLDIDSDHELRLPDPERAPGDIYYARVTWTDGELAWTSPVVVR